MQVEVPTMRTALLYLVSTNVNDSADKLKYFDILRPQIWKKFFLSNRIFIIITALFAEYFLNVQRIIVLHHGFLRIQRLFESEKKKIPINWILKLIL